MQQAWFDETKIETEPEFVAFVGIDWADEEHVWCWQKAGEGKREKGVLTAQAGAVEGWIGELARRFGPGPIAVAVEQTRAALLWQLSKYEHLHLYVVPPQTSAQFRKTFYPSGAKDDGRDAELLLDLVLQHRRRLRCWAPDTEQTRRVQNLVEERRKLVNEKTAILNSLTARLKLYFPQMLKWFDPLGTSLVCDLLERWPTLEQLQKVPISRLRQFFHRHHCRQAKLIATRIEEISTARPALKDRAIVEVQASVVPVLVQLLHTLRSGIEKLDRQMAEAVAEHPDYYLYQSLPGAGPVMAPRLLAAMGTQRDRYRSAQELQAFTGIAPVMEQSGKSKWVHSRWRCPKFLRQSFHEWAGHSIRFCPWARAFYQQQRTRGKGHHAATRSLAFKWMRILFRCWQDRVPYNEALYLNMLAQRGSSLVATPACGQDVRPR
ncbi:MAG TPA: IS110 family transposase [Candidatus Angelobacter sp.]|nr:IS110 family transposase [Candidatus Angelobacter sp.]